MRIRIAAIITVLALLAPASAAVAQSNPFQGLPPAQPTPAPTVAPANNTSSSSSDDVGRNTLYIIGGALLVAFVGIGVWISRDARRNLPQDERDHLGRARDAGPHKREREAKAKARAKGRAQRQARRATRNAKARR